MKASYHIKIFITIILSCHTYLLAQNRTNDKLGNESQSNPFVFSTTENVKYKNHQFVPNRNNIKAFYRDGTFIYLPKLTEVYNGKIYSGSYNNKEGFWLLTFFCKLPSSQILTDGRYIFLGDLDDIQSEIDAQEAERQKAERSKIFESILNILPSVTIVIGIIIFFSGFASTCPKCNTWWKRKYERTESLGYSTYSGTRSVRKEIHGTESGGYVYVDEPYTKTTHHYRNHYHCKKCGHKWTKDKSS